MRWLVLIGGFVIVAWLFQDSPTGISIAGGVVYVIFLAMKKSPRAPQAPRVTPVVAPAAERWELPPEEPSHILLQRNDLSPEERSVTEPSRHGKAAAVPPETSSPPAEPLAPTALEKAWIDPRRWATLVRAYGLFVTVAALSSYNNTWRLILARWMFSPAETSGAWLQAMKLALFFLPFMASQLLTATWLLLIRPRRPDTSDRAYRVSCEVIDDIGPRRGYRSVRLMVATVAQPHLVSILAKPFLILPRQGLAYYEQRALGSAEETFRAVIAHEIGHLESWDDLLFLPSFSYIAASILLCLFGIYEVFTGRIALSAVFSQILAVSALAVLASYVIRRREAYSDSFSVVVLGSVEATTRALEALRKDAAVTRSWLTTHFDVSNRLALLARRGRPFLEMARYDLAITAFIYFNLDKSSVKDVAAGAGVVWDLTLTIDAVARFVLLWLMLLMIAGACLARRGEPMSVRDLFVAAALCIIGRDLFSFLRVGVFSAIQTAMAAGITILSIAISAVAFVVIMRVLNRWTIAILGRTGGDARERLVWGALWIAVAFTVPLLLYEIGGAAFARSVANAKTIETVGAGSTTQQFTLMLPMFIMVAMLWTVQIGAAATVAIWSWNRSRSIPDVQCPSCGMKLVPKELQHPITLSCPRCEAILRADLVTELEGEGVPA